MTSSCIARNKEVEEIRPGDEKQSDRKKLMLLDCGKPEWIDVQLLSQKQRSQGGRMKVDAVMRKVKR